MKVATCFQMTCLSVLLLLVVVTTTTAFVVVSSPRPTTTTKMWAADDDDQKTVVEVCGSKDCKRGGGGPRLEKFIGEVSLVVMLVVCLSVSTVYESIVSQTSFRFIHIDLL